MIGARKESHRGHDSKPAHSSMSFICCALHTRMIHDLHARSGEMSARGVVAEALVRWFGALRAYLSSGMLRGESATLHKVDGRPRPSTARIVLLGRKERLIP